MPVDVCVLGCGKVRHCTLTKYSQRLFTTARNTVGPCRVFFFSSFSRATTEEEPTSAEKKKNFGDTSWER